MCAEFAVFRNHQKGVMRAVYIAPLEALAKDLHNVWKKQFGEGLGMRVVELIGETATDLKLLQRDQVLSRQWKQRKHIQQ